MFLIKLPQKLQKEKQVLLYKWLKETADTTGKGDSLCIIQAGADRFEVQSPESGTLLGILPASGSVFSVDTPLAVLGEKGQDASQIIEQYKQKQTTPAPSVKTQASKDALKTGDSLMKHEKEVPAAGHGPVIPILMPQAGQSMEEGTIISWKVKEGDRIEVGQVIMEIETDKATMEVEAVDAGRIAKIVANEGDIVEVKVPVAYIAEENVNIDAYLASTGTITETPPPPSETPAVSTPQKASTTAQKTPAPVSEGGRVKASPAARKAARQAGVDLASIGAGSGPGGRILSTDIKTADVSTAETRTYTVNKMRRAIAKNLIYSKQNIPHFYAKITIDAGLLFDTYRKTKEQFKCSINDFITRACAKAIRQYPAFRSHYKDTEVIEHTAVNIGIAVGTENGLTVPVVLGADKMNLKDLAAKTRQVVEQARNGKLEGIGQGLFTITNLGMFGVEEFSAIINPPESAILAVGAIREDVAVKDGQMHPTRLMTMTLSSDHRIIDGVIAAQFLQTVKELLENPQPLIS